VTDVTRFGAFVDWGKPKELLVPYAEQTCDMRVGQRYAIGLTVDDAGRPAGTMRVSEMLRSKGDFAPDQWVDGEAWRNEPEIGLFVIVERAFVGLVPASEPHSLSRGETARFRVAHVLPDKKIELSLRALAHEELEGDAERVLDVLAKPGAPRLGDRSSPEEIRSQQEGIQAGRGAASQAEGRDDRRRRGRARRPSRQPVSLTPAPHIDGNVSGTMPE
jgi:hypothetical protein